MQELKRGGKREGSGRKPSGITKKLVSLYVDIGKIYKFGNEIKMKEKIYGFIESFGQFNAGIKPEENGTPTAISHTTKQQLGLEKTFQQHMNELPSLDTEYDYRKKAEEIESAQTLSRKQKDLLILNMRQSKL